MTGSDRFLQDPGGFEDKRCDECRINYVLPKGAALPCGHEKGSHMPDWYGTTGRDDLVGGGDHTQFHTTIDDITLCSVKPFTDEEVAALREYFRLLAEKRRAQTDSAAEGAALPCGHKGGQQK